MSSSKIVNPAGSPISPGKTVADILLHRQMWEQGAFLEHHAHLTLLGRNRKSRLGNRPAGHGDGA